MKGVVALSTVLSCIGLLAAICEASTLSSSLSALDSNVEKTVNKLRGGVENTIKPNVKYNHFLRKPATTAHHSKTRSAIEEGTHVFRENAISLVTSDNAQSKKAPFHVTRSDIKLIGRASAASRHEVVIGVKQRNLDTVEDLLWSVSDPRNSQYGKHLNRKQMRDLTRNEEAIEAIKSHLVNEHKAVIVRESYGGEYLTVSLTVAEAERLFATEFYHFEYTDKSKTHNILRAQSYAIPTALHAHIDHVFNTVHFPVPNRINAMKSTKDSIAPLPYQVTPNVLQDFYMIPSLVGNDMTSQAVYETVDQAMSPTDLSIFQTEFNIPLQSIANDIGGHVFDNACVDSIDNCLEANLDIQYMMGVAQSVPTTYFYWGEPDFMLDWITTVVNSPDDPQSVYSISYGADEMYFPLSYAQAFNVEAMKLGLMGTTITVSAGDDGALSPSVRDSTSFCGYSPSFPATSPYVVAVGATMLSEVQEEVFCSTPNGAIITGGGGFSSLYPQPSFQSSAVMTYLDIIQSATSDVTPGFVSDGRGYPDVSLFGHGYYVIAAGQNMSVDGTSASSPVFAAMISLVNSQRKAMGKSTLGYITPTLYSDGWQFTWDIVNGGKNNCSAGQPDYNCCSEGFTTTVGWDATSGLGSVNVSAFQSWARTYAGSSDDDNTSNNNDDSYSLSQGGVAGVVVGVIVGCAVIAALCYYVFYVMVKGPLVGAQMA